MASWRLRLNHGLRLSINPWCSRQGASHGVGRPGTRTTRHAFVDTTRHGHGVRLTMGVAHSTSGERRVMAQRRDIVEVFGYSPTDLTNEARALWRQGFCPFINKPCTKFNHDKTVVYGTCSVTSPQGNVMICPNRLYADGYQCLREVAADAFGTESSLLLLDEYLSMAERPSDCVVALGTNSGKEVRLRGSMSMDWVLAETSDGALTHYVGVEVQSIDTTGNYRDAWQAYRSLPRNPGRSAFPHSAHGLNWANVHKRLVPQLIRKGLVYSRSLMVTSGLYFIVPDIVYQRFEDLIEDIPTFQDPARDRITVITYALGDAVPHGAQRAIREVRRIRFQIDEFAWRFVRGANLPSGTELDREVRSLLELS